jgi:hypothetical protein
MNVVVDSRDVNSKALYSNQNFSNTFVRSLLLRRLGRIHQDVRSKSNYRNPKETQQRKKQFGWFHGDPPKRLLYNCELHSSSCNVSIVNSLVAVNMFFRFHRPQVNNVPFTSAANSSEILLSNNVIVKEHYLRTIIFFVWVNEPAVSL